MADQVSLGSIVRLKSDGPWMTVTKTYQVNGTPYVNVAWFLGEEPRESNFPIAALDIKPKA